MKKSLAILTFCILLIPTIVSAAWWNPISWFKKQEMVSPTPSALTEEQPKSEPFITTTPETKTIEKIVEKPIIRTETITVQDPALQKRIDVLVTENNDLKSELSKLRSKYNDLAEELSKLKSSTKKISQECSASKEKQASLINQIAGVEQKYQVKLSERPAGMTVDGYSARNIAIGRERKAEVDPLEIELTKTQQLTVLNCM